MSFVFKLLVFYFLLKKLSKQYILIFTISCPIIIVSTRILMLFKHKTIAHEKESQHKLQITCLNVHVKVLATICTNKMNYMFICRTICVRSLENTVSKII